MRKVTRQIADAFKNGEKKTVGNTSTFDGKVFLHGNEIAKIKDGALLMTLARWNTPTTRERLNGIADAFGSKARFIQKNFEPHMDSGFGAWKIRDDVWYWIADIDNQIGDPKHIDEIMDELGLLT